jgi:hypothetical protein
MKATVCLPERDAKQLEKYDRLKETERKMREAILTKTKVFDTDFVE